MTELSQPQTTMSSRKHMERSLWQKQVNEAMRLKFLEALTQTKFSLVDPSSLTKVTKRSRVMLRCVCGDAKERQVSQIVFDGVKGCRSCGYTGMTELRQKNIAKKTKYAHDPDRKAIAAIVFGARSRCQNPANPVYKNYGGRGIRFEFENSEIAVDYIYKVLGPRPSKQHTLDRIDNDKGYAAGNLRWADRHTQRINQRETYRKGKDYDRLTRLRELRPDYSWESLRQFVKRGLSDEEILAHKKGKHYGIFTRKNVISKLNSA